MKTVVVGTFREGKVEFDQAPSLAEETKVLVTFPIDESDPTKCQRIWFGMFKGDVETTEEDFKMAEWHGDPDDGLDWSGC